MKVKPILRKYDFRPKKRWGQNFLLNDRIRDKIIGILAIKPTDSVMEIGPGLGILTGQLTKYAKDVIAVEKDKRLCGILKEFLVGRSNLRIICDDILMLDLAGLVSHNKKLKVIGNLPYYITSPIIFHLLKAREIIDTILITVQKEVGQRLLAKPGIKNYSALSVNIRFYSEPSLHGIIKKDSFYPRPKVDSSIIKLKLFEHPPVRVSNKEKFFELVRASFNKRRKTILNALLGSEYFSLKKEEWSGIFKKSQLDPARRAETFTLEEFAKLFNNIKSP